MRRDVNLLQDILRTAHELEPIVAGLDYETFCNTDVVRSSTIYKLIIMGEAVARLSEDLRRRFEEIAWPAIISVRNRATHAYFAVDWNIVYQIATRDVPELESQRRTILDVLTPEAEA